MDNMLPASINNSSIMSDNFNRSFGNNTKEYFPYFSCMLNFKKNFKN